MVKPWTFIAKLQLSAELLGTSRHISVVFFSSELPAVNITEIFYVFPGLSLHRTGLSIASLGRWLV